MNKLLIGDADKTEQLLQIAKPPFLLIDDGPIADAFLEKFPKAKLFDPTVHSFNPVRGIDYKRARDLVTTIYTAFPEGKDTLTVRNGKRALARMVLKGSRLDRLEGATSDPGEAEALATVNDILFSPVVKQVLCGDPNFSFKGSVIAKLDRAEMGDLDAFILASLLMGQFKGQVIISDGSYLRDTHMSLIRQNRLICSVITLEELPPKIRQKFLLLKDIDPKGALFEDAEVLAKYAGLVPNTVGHTEFIARAMA